MGTVIRDIANIANPETMLPALDSALSDASTMLTTAIAVISPGRSFGCGG